MLKGFRDFLLRGNVVDLAVAVIIGTAFSAVVTSLNKDVITQLIAAVGGVPDFSKESFAINGTPIGYGNLITTIINFVIVAAVVYFVVSVWLGCLGWRAPRPAPDAHAPR